MSAEHLDPAVLAALPPGSEIISIAQHGKTNWSTGLRIDVNVNDDEQEFFIKILDRQDAAQLAEGEYEAEKALIEYIPENVVHPIAWGRFQDDPSKAFFLTTFRNLRARSPSIAQFLPILKKLHQESVSPNGKFGFHVTTFYGASPMINDWTDSWEEFFARELRSNLEYAFRYRGDDPELRKVADEFFAKVIPRLMRPLQTNGRSIKPTLCHGDLWDGNIQIDVDTKQPVIFDACCFYGHSEMDLQCMRDPRYAIGLEFVDQYKKEVGMSEPHEDFDDRNAVYSMRNDVLTAGMWPQWAPLLQRVKQEMLRLLAKYPDGLAGFQDPREKGLNGIAA
ncbi:hypothetical protein FE257_010832 [Aspergillus nanangensis]|uniref:protein-ribulosamine 3-kinase n=1 Tax=Aspergillus nanangensis TaxID=2582783 RepID=A0AAD4CVK3_ASPNN|nr:hypothetical protein FE257_010832 [Aspergillus nanangensis]